jgi:predicted transcriptional regulator
MAIRAARKIELQAITTRFPQDLLERIDQYADFLGGATERSYVIVEAVRAEIARNREFREWVKERQTGSVAPARSAAEKSSAA